MPNEEEEEPEMLRMTPQQVADYLEEASEIEQSIDAGFAVLHIGKNAAGVRFMLMNDMHGETTITEGM